jgi:hypothetical protein
MKAELPTLKAGVGKRCNGSIARLATQKVGEVVVNVCTGRVGFGVVLGCYWLSILSKITLTCATLGHLRLRMD